MVISGGSPRPGAPRLPDQHQTREPIPPRKTIETHRLLEDVVGRQCRGVGWGGQVAQDRGGGDRRWVDHPKRCSRCSSQRVHHLMVDDQMMMTLVMLLLGEKIIPASLQHSDTHWGRVGCAVRPQVAGRGETT